MRRIDYIVVHCTATSKKATVENIQKYWSDVLGWKNPGYHFLIEPDGNIVQLQDVEKPTNGVRGHNANSVHVSYIGGIDYKGMPKDTRTEAQKDQMAITLHALKSTHPSAKILGHRDFPGVTKACPSFDVKKWLEELQLF